MDGPMGASKIGFEWLLSTAQKQIEVEQDKLKLESINIILPANATWATKKVKYVMKANNHFIPPRLSILLTKYKRMLNLKKVNVY